MESCGRGHHKRRRKGARQAFFRRKNDERRRQQANKENIVSNTSQPTSLTSTTMTLSDLQQSMANVSLPEHWQAFNADGVVQWSRMEIGHGSLLQPTASILLYHSLTWSVHIRGKKVPATCKLLAEFPSLISSPTILSDLICCVHQAAVCPGNTDKDFVTVCEKRGGTMKKGGDVIAYLDSTSPDGHCSVRRAECDVIFDHLSRRVRCQACQSFRSTLRSAVHRSSHDNTAVSSHTNYIHLTPDEKNERLKNLHQSLRAAKQQSNRLQSKINQLIESEGIQLQPNDAEDISQIVEDVTPTVVENFPESSPQRVFWDQQRIYNRLGNKRQMRWHPLVLRFALNLKYMSTSAYRAVRQSGIINLPSERTLSDYTHWISPHSGLQVEYVDKLHTMLAEAFPSQQHQCTLSMDEMKIKSGLVFNKHTGSLVGFVDLGDVNRDIQKIISGEHGESTSGNLASHVFVLMARAVFKPSLCVPVAHYFSSNLKGKISMNVTVCV